METTGREIVDNHHFALPSLLKVVEISEVVPLSAIR